MVVGSIVGLKHLYRQGDTLYYRRRIPKDLLEYYSADEKHRSGIIQRSLSTGDIRQAQTPWAQIHAELESEWARVREHVARINEPQLLDRIEENVARELIWKSWLAWKALGLDCERNMDDFGAWTLEVIERLPASVEMMPPRSIKLWHDSLAQQPQLRLLTEYALNAIARELPLMAPVVTASPAIDLAKNRAYAIRQQKPRMLGEVMDDWIGHARRKNLKTRRDKDGKPYKVADKNYAVPFKIAKDVLGENTIVSHIGRDEIIELVEIIRHLPKGAHEMHSEEGLSFRQIADETKRAMEDGEEPALNADSTLNKYLQTITTLFTHAQANMWISEHPALKIKIPARERRS